MKFRQSEHAHKWLKGLIGIEIGGSAHNPFGLDTLNVDRLHHTDTMFEPYAKEQLHLCGEVMPVDVIAPGDKLPFKNKSFDFVISSHVIEHFYDPIAALKEWARVAIKYIYVICPHRDALPSDRDKPLTTLDEHIGRHQSLTKLETDEHHSRWTPESFVTMCAHFGFVVVDMLPTDDKVGNGFTVVIDVRQGRQTRSGKGEGRGA
jgi:SAM-dependent methyltransferase